MTCSARRANAPQLVDYVINDKCIGCQACATSCPTSAISGDKKTLHIVDQVKCIKCGHCITVCPVDAVSKLAEPKPRLAAAAK